MNKSRSFEKFAADIWKALRPIRIVFQAVMDFLGIIVPSIAFFTIFATFLITIASRYIFKNPVTWSYEVAVLGYMWTMFFGVGLAIRKDDHVVFSLVYDSLRPMGKLLCKVFYNLLLAALLAVILEPCRAALAKSTMITGVLKLPYSAVFAPFVFMLADSIARSAGNIGRAFSEYKALKGGMQP